MGCGGKGGIGRSVGNSLRYDDDLTERLAVAFGWIQLLRNLQSGEGRIVILELTEVAAADRQHAAGAWDESDQKLQQADERFQPHIAHDWLDGGAPICRPDFVREGACLINLFLETFADSINARLKRPHKDLTHERLYEMAAGSKAPADGPLPVSLKEANAWVRKWKIPFRAINLAGELVHRWLPKDEGKKANNNLWRALPLMNPMPSR